MKQILEKDIVLDKESHKYSLTSQPGLEFTSVTTFIDHFFEGFDAPKIAKKLIKHYPKYAGRTVESLIADWDAAANYGTMVHDQIEQWIKEDVEPKEEKAIRGKEWLKNLTSASEHDILSEVVVCSAELKIAGTVDILAKDKSTGKCTLIDWKTSKKIETSSYGNKMGTHDTTRHVMDCNYYHYALQLSLYRYIIEEYYSVEIHGQVIAHLQDDRVNAINTPYMRDEIVAMLGTFGTGS